MSRASSKHIISKFQWITQRWTKKSATAGRRTYAPFKETARLRGHLQCRSRRTGRPKALHWPHRATVQNEVQQPHAVSQAREILKQHWALQVHLAAEKEQHPVQHQVVDRKKIRGIQQRNETMWPLLDGKALHHQLGQDHTTKQMTRTHIQVPPWKQILLTELQRRLYVECFVAHEKTVTNNFPM